MLKIDKDNNIRLTRGDSLSLTLALSKDGEAYTPENGDTIRFAMSKGYVTDADYALTLEKTIPTNTMTLSLSSSETKVAYGDYNYDIQITHNNGAVDTFISAKIKITGEVA